MSISPCSLPSLIFARFSQIVLSPLLIHFFFHLPSPIPESLIRFSWHALEISGPVSYGNEPSLRLSPSTLQLGEEIENQRQFGEKTSLREPEASRAIDILCVRIHNS
jgi:hypothetical protein